MLKQATSKTIAGKKLLGNKSRNLQDKEIKTTFQICIVMVNDPISMTLTRIRKQF